MMTPVPMPLTRGRWFSSVVNGQRLAEADRFSLVMLTTLAWTFCTASTTGVRRADGPPSSRGGFEAPRAVATTRAAIHTPFLRVHGSGTVGVLKPRWDCP